MTDWSQLKVTDLKEELKSRGISLTGLKLKQQLIDKLEEIENDGTDASVGAVTGELSEPPAPNDLYPKPQEDTTNEQEPVTEVNDDTTKELVPAVKADEIESPKAEETNGSYLPVSNDKPVTTVAEKNEVDNTEIQIETKKSPEPDAEQAETQSAEAIIGQPIADTTEIVEIEGKPQQTESSVQNGEEKKEECDRSRSREDNIPVVHTAEAEKVEMNHNRLANGLSPIDEPASSAIDGTHKRKRRSTSPVPTEEDIARKRARISKGEEVVSKRESNALEQMQEATDAARALRDPNGLGGQEMPEEAVIEEQDTEMADPDPTNTLIANPAVGNEGTGQAIGTGPSTSNGSLGKAPLDSQLSAKPEEGSKSGPITTNTQDRSERKATRSKSPQRSESPHRDIVPAMHPATSSLYIRNFKRPLHVQSLKQHISNLAQKSSKEMETDSITTFYLDMIRTHCFISFRSVAAAARVRNAIHDTRFPDEPIRDRLFVDFVPDEKVQSWIDEEGRASQGGSRRRFEVVYDEGSDGIEARLQEVGQQAQQQKRKQPSIQPSYNESRRRLSYQAADPSVHPDRAGLASQEDPYTRNSRPSYADDSRRNRPPPTGPQVIKHTTNNGTGFAALDTLFSSTTTKPKLYFKPVSQMTSDSRLALIERLRLSHDNMGKSGDEGMKRFSFAVIDGDAPGKESWVDKGPEFGYGRKGVERLEGRLSGYGGGSGGGSYRGSRRGGSRAFGGSFGGMRSGGDSWRGSGYR